ncbi:SIMPL domain-containing protein [Paenibacillus marinisediminis]
MNTGWKRPLAAAVLGVALIFGATGGLGWSQPSVVEAAGDSMRNVVSVNGIGSLELDPDIAYVNMGVMTNAESASKAQELNAAAFNKVYKVLTETYGINAKDIKTTEFSVQPQYQYKENQEPKVVGYNAEHMIKVNYRDMKKLGELVDAASKAGANRINSISFDVENQSGAETAALEQAVQHAKKKAEALAKAGGRQLGAVISITETSSDYRPVQMNYDMLAAKADFAEMKSAPQAGQVQLQTRVQIDFELK